MNGPIRSAADTSAGINVEIERRILRARTAAIDALEQGNWDAVVLSCGKVLQEVARNELPYNEHGGTLPQLLERLARRLQTDQPVSELAAALKDAGGLRGFFDLEADVDEELARATLSVIESFLTYTYRFREEVRRLAELAATRRTAAPMEDATAHAAAPERASRPGAGEAARASQHVASEPSGSERRTTEERKPASESPTRPAPSRERPPSAFDGFDERSDDPIRQTWKPPRRDE